METAQWRFHVWARVDGKMVPVSGGKWCEEGVRRFLKRHPNPRKCIFFLQAELNGTRSTMETMSVLAILWDKNTPYVEILDAIRWVGRDTVWQFPPLRWVVKQSRVWARPPRRWTIIGQEEYTSLRSLLRDADWPGEGAGLLPDVRQGRRVLPRKTVQAEAERIKPGYYMGFSHKL